ncbi:hypothetical protein KPL47_22540 [Clostridium estertheticum]|uniref:hypothetical protein n=1 Tax=Clostridium estertheticum TaxID=238834 RepID=UPI001C0E3680|nr:hypothetical protein [Clostridium estertheticum]MBU3179078.1 hypothetical protein [Clostridium estertheticum]
MEISIIRDNKTIVNHEFKSLSRKHAEDMELIATKIIGNTRTKKATVFLLGSLMYFNNVVTTVMAANKDPLKTLPIVGNKILDIIQMFGWFICAIGCAIAVLKALMAGDTKSIPKIMMGFGMGFASLYLFPAFLDMIKGIFN